MKIENSKEMIWYVCYGSNLCLDRFMCYLTGKGNKDLNVKENTDRMFFDQSIPKGFKNVEIPYELYFAKESKNWGGSVAF